MRIWTIAGVLPLLLSIAAAPEDLPPEVVLLARIKSHLRGELSQLPNYTCLETVNRFHKENAHSPFRPLDTVRLEIVYSDHREWYGSPGDANLGASSPVSFVGSGLIGSGAFAGALNNILAGAHFVYQGKDALGDRASVRYDFQFPRQPNAFAISVPGGVGTVGEKGSVWVDEQSLDLIRLDYHADDIPTYLPLAAQSSNVSYARVRVGDASALLAQQADIRLVLSAGVEDYDHVEFTHCRAYSAQTEIIFNTEPVEAAVTPAKVVPAAPPKLPALLTVTVQLVTPVSSRDAVGQLIEGKVAGEVRYKGKVVVPAGAPVRGRIRRLEHYLGKTTKDRGDFIVGLEFTELEVNGVRMPFYADLLSMDKSSVVRPRLSERVPVGNEEITLPELPGVALFFADGQTFTIAGGFKTVWRTRGPIRGY